jgi:hypothetical protein
LKLIFSAGDFGWLARRNVSATLEISPLPVSKLRDFVVFPIADQSSLFGLDRRCFFSEWTRFSRRRVSRTDRGTLVFLRRFGGDATVDTISWSLDSQSAMFFAWSRYLWLLKTSSPRSLMRRAYRASNLWRTSSGKARLATTDQRSWTFEFTLLTFWPPGPELRMKDKENSARGMLI